MAKKIRRKRGRKRREFLTSSPPLVQEEVPPKALASEPEPPIRREEDNGWRICKRPALYGLEPCTAKFRPISETMFHCSNECATLSFAHRSGWTEKNSHSVRSILVQIAQAGVTRQDRAERMRGLRTRLRVRPSVPRTAEAFPPGTKVHYLGGSKALWLPEGETGVIVKAHGTTTLRYAIRFPQKTTVLGALYVALVENKEEKGDGIEAVGAAGRQRPRAKSRTEQGRSIAPGGHRSQGDPDPSHPESPDLSPGRASEVKKKKGGKKK